MHRCLACTGVAFTVESHILFWVPINMHKVYAYSDALIAVHCTPAAHNVYTAVALNNRQSYCLNIV